MNSVTKCAISSKLVWLIAALVWSSVNGPTNRGSSLQAITVILPSESLSAPAEDPLDDGASVLMLSFMILRKYVDVVGSLHYDVQRVNCGERQHYF